MFTLVHAEKNQKKRKKKVCSNWFIPSPAKFLKVGVTDQPTDLLTGVGAKGASKKYMPPPKNRKRKWPAPLNLNYMFIEYLLRINPSVLCY